LDLMRIRPGDACVSAPLDSEGKSRARTRRAQPSRVVIQLTGRLRPALASSAELRPERGSGSQR
jgi:hypothetical protein